MWVFELFTLSSAGNQLLLKVPPSLPPFLHSPLFSEALGKMKDVYEKNPQMGDPASLASQISQTSQNMERLTGERVKYEVIRPSVVYSHLRGLFIYHDDISLLWHLELYKWTWVYILTIKWIIINSTSYIIFFFFLCRPGWLRPWAEGRLCTINLTHSTTTELTMYSGNTKFCS